MTFVFVQFAQCILSSLILFDSTLSLKLYVVQDVQIHCMNSFVSEKQKTVELNSGSRKGKRKDNYLWVNFGAVLFGQTLFKIQIFLKLQV